ncbi:KDGP aldolase [Brevibacillus laterosporus]|uniref:4-hydroxy-2-ketovalerate aldolase n=1 Tax=Brevibacillus laterosporus TaxID=1465 RepID=A0AAP8QH88_BRELA|nr:KDGP aldolase [Brevibacillus laterosporus]MED1666507.1 KDGP aldolase [Brevibacillus laterosporus]MED1669818.1 KDGP aldolase [Brevibacillus laterosporus]MED1720314.1 KDGP aldolase [Brevibacillus laterosporus]PPA89293.1 4-hydroxy-2-ketovalerate aldolase [Brevibacillus laterosporus]PPB13177.1 4-hydroxy-2-ketovalerate aldolase [Brevibacillus laterosporus]
MSSNVKVRVNLLARDPENAKDIMEILNGQVLVGIMVKSFPSVQLAVEKVEEYQRAGIPVSVGLGAADPTQWKKVADVAKLTIPPHVNQVFPAAGYTIGLLEGEGATNTVVNAVITPSGTIGKVYVTTGPESQKYEEAISCEAAAALIADMGIPSVKFYPLNNRLDELAVMVKAAVEAGITIFEPTGGITVENMAETVRVCISNGAREVIPHIYTSIVDKATGLTKVEDVQALKISLAEWL